MGRDRNSRDLETLTTTTTIEQIIAGRWAVGHHAIRPTGWTRHFFCWFPRWGPDDFWSFLFFPNGKKFDLHATSRSYCAAAADSRAHRRRFGLAHRDRLCSVRDWKRKLLFQGVWNWTRHSRPQANQRRMKSINLIIHWNKLIPTNWILLLLLLRLINCLNKRKKGREHR